MAPPLPAQGVVPQRKMELGHSQSLPPPRQLFNPKESGASHTPRSVTDYFFPSCLQNRSGSGALLGKALPFSGVPVY